MRTNIGAKNVNSLIERSIIVIFSFFVDQEFNIVVDVNDFVVNLQPTITLSLEDCNSHVYVKWRGKKYRSIICLKKESNLLLKVLFELSWLTKYYITNYRLMKVNKLVYEDKHFILYSFSA